MWMWCLGRKTAWGLTGENASIVLHHLAGAYMFCLFFLRHSPGFQTTPGGRLVFVWMLLCTHHVLIAPVVEASLVTLGLLCRAVLCWAVSCRLVHWCGAQLQVPHRAVRELGFQPQHSGVFISRWHHGSPAHRYGLFALHWILEVGMQGLMLQHTCCCVCLALIFPSLIGSGCLALPCLCSTSHSSLVKSARNGCTP